MNLSYAKKIVIACEVLCYTCGRKIKLCNVDDTMLGKMNPCMLSTTNALAGANKFIAQPRLQVVGRGSGLYIGKVATHHTSTYING